ncbi:hypothetical protein U1Q18_041903 [Sarracenia purpurea var. burkii]
MESDDKSSDSAEWIRVGRRRKVNKDSKRDIHPMGSRQDHPDQAAAFPAGPAYRSHGNGGWNLRLYDFFVIYDFFVSGHLDGYSSMMLGSNRCSSEDIHGGFY